MVSDDSLFILFPNFDPLPHGPKITGIKKCTLQQGSVPYQKEISFQGGEILLEISYWKIWLTLQYALQWSLIFYYPTQSHTWWFHFYWFLYIDKYNVNRGRGNGYRQQQINFNQKGNHKIVCYTKSILIFTAYQVQGIVKNQLEVVEVKIPHSVLIDTFCIVQCLLNVLEWHKKNYCTL